jgi:hypothetical protein
LEISSGSKFSVVKKPPASVSNRSGTDRMPK